jgi:hypothetical protein
VARQTAECNILHRASGLTANSANRARFDLDHVAI